MAQPEKTTEEIIRELKQGRDREENARLLFQRYYGHVYRFFRSKGILPEDGEELTEDVLISVYNKLDELREEPKFENWMFRIAMNVYRNEIERRGAKKRAVTEVRLEGDADGLEELHLRPSPAVDPETEVLEKEKLEKVREALRALPEQMRSCLLLRVDDELSYREIAAVMGISVNTVSVHLHQARKVLKEKLGRYFGELDIGSEDPDDG